MALIVNFLIQPVAEPPSKASDSVKVCRKCHAEIGRGKAHHCSAAEAVKNLTKAALEIGANFGQSGSKSYQRVSSNLIKTAEAEQNVPRGEAMKLATGIFMTEGNRLINKRNVTSRPIYHI